MTDRDQFGDFCGTGPAIPAAQSVGGWQPIETAPKEGVFLVYMPDARPGEQMHVARQGPNLRVIGGLFAFDRPPASHWMPLPAPPAAREDR